MNWEELIQKWQLDDIVVTIINPVRKEEWYKTGRLTGFKSGLWGGGHYNYKNGKSHSFDSTRVRCLKKPKVQVTYNVFTYRGKEHSDWIDFDNCEFTIKTQEEIIETPQFPKDRITKHN